MYHAHLPYNHNHSLGVYFAADVEYFGKASLCYHSHNSTVCVCSTASSCAHAIPNENVSQDHKFVSLSLVHLNTFVDLFHGSYSQEHVTVNGLHQLSWSALSGSMLVLYTTLKDTSIILILYSMLLVIYSGLIGAFQPFKSSVSHYNVINSVLFLFLSLFMLALCGFRVAELVNPQLVMAFAVAAFILAAVPLIYIAGVTLFWFYTHRRFGFHILHGIKARIKGYDQINDDLPDRIEKPWELLQEKSLQFCCTALRA